MADEDKGPEAALSQADFFSLFKDGLTYFMRKAKESLEVGPSDLIRFIRYPSAPVQPGPLTYLGVLYPSLTDIAFLDGI